MKELSQEYVRSLFDYRDGGLYWKKSRRGINFDNLAGWFDGRYRCIMVNGKQYYAHRLIFLYHHGYLPKEIDHINGDKLNNSIANLRNVTRQENVMNRGKYKFINGKPTSSGFKGVSWDKQREKWRSYTTIGDKYKHLGYFDSEIKAAKAYNRAVVELFGEIVKINEV